MSNEADVFDPSTCAVPYATRHYLAAGDLDLLRWTPGAARRIAARTGRPHPAAEWLIGAVVVELERRVAAERADFREPLVLRPPVLDWTNAQIGDALDLFEVLVALSPSPSRVLEDLRSIFALEAGRRLRKR